VESERQIARSKLGIYALIGSRTVTLLPDNAYFEPKKVLFCHFNRLSKRIAAIGYKDSVFRPKKIPVSKEPLYAKGRADFFIGYK
jgi:hypothetical protein